MKVVQTTGFEKTVQKLHKSQKSVLDKVVKLLMDNPSLGKIKKGDLDWLRVHKFNILNQEFLLGYQYREKSLTLTLVALGPHENFYRDIKKKFN